MLKINQLSNNIRNKVVDRSILLWIIDETFKIKYPEFQRVPAQIWREIPKYKDFLDERSFNEYNEFIIDKISFNSIRNQIDNFQGNIGRFYDRIHKMFQNCRDFNNSAEDKVLCDLSIRLQNDIVKIIENKFNLEGLNKRKRNDSIDKEKQINSIKPKPKILKSVNNLSINNHVLFQSSSPNSITTIDEFDFLESDDIETLQAVKTDKKVDEIKNGLNVLNSVVKKVKSFDKPKISVKHKTKKIIKKKIKIGYKTGLLAKLRKINRNNLNITNNDIKNKFNNYLSKNNYDLNNLHYNLVNSKDINIISKIRETILAIDSFFDELLSISKKNISVEREVNNVLQSLISTLEFPEKIRLIRSSESAKKNIKKNTKTLNNLNKKYKELSKKKEKMDNSIENIRFNSGRLRNNIFVLANKYKNENYQYKALKSRHKDLLNGVTKLSKENFKFKKIEDEFNKKTKVNDEYKKNIKMIEDKINSLTQENSTISSELKSLKKKYQVEYDKNLEIEREMRILNRVMQKFKKTAAKYKELNDEKNELQDKDKELHDKHKNLSQDILELKNKHQDEYNKFILSQNAMRAFNTFIRNQNSVIKKLENFKQYKNRLEVNYSNSSSDIEIVNSMNIPDRCKICAKHYKDHDFSGMCVAFPCGHTGICLSCVNRGYKNKLDNGKHDKCFMRNCCSKKCFYTKVIL